MVTAWLVTAYLAQRYRGQRNDLAAALVHIGYLTMDEITKEEESMTRED